MKVLFICRGNVGRSQVAEAIFNSLVGNKHVAFSAGTKVNENEGQKLKELKTAINVLSVLDELGIDARDKKRNQLTPKMLDKADVVVTMAETETIPKYLKNNKKVIYWDIIDLFEQSLESTRQGREKINALVQVLINSIN